MHRPFVLLACAFILLGSGLGLFMLPLLAGWGGDALSWAPRLQAHGQFQLLGFCVLFTMGIAYQMLGELLGARPAPAMLFTVLLLMAAGTVGQAVRPAPIWEGCQFLSALLFVAGVARHRPKIHNGTERPRPGRAHSHFLRWGSLWLLVALTRPQALTYELILWGFLTLYILGVGLRVHPEMLQRPHPRGPGSWLVLVLWNVGLLFICLGQTLSASLCWLAGCLVFMAALPPWPQGRVEQDWPFTYYLSAAYLWLLVACLGRLALASGICPESWSGAVKHAHASGFVLTMMIGMGLRLVPAFEGRTPGWPWVRWACLPLLVLGTVLRVVGQAGPGGWVLMGGGTLQATAVLLFALSTLLTVAPRRLVSKTSPARPVQRAVA